MSLSQFHATAIHFMAGLVIVATIVIILVLIRRGPKPPGDHTL